MGRKLTLEKIPGFPIILYVIRGFYIAAEGMTARQRAQDVIASNLANLNTTGFKADRPLFQASLEKAVYRAQDGAQARIGSLSHGARLETTLTDLSEGALQVTGNPLDLALVGEGYFAVQTPQGARYTRNGAFSLNNQRQLVTREGYQVIGRQGAIQVPPNTNLRIDEEGGVWIDESRVNQLLIVSGALTKEPSGWFAGNATPLPKPTLQSGALEASNVNVVREMVSMIEGMRLYEAHQKLLQAQDETLGRAINDLAKI